MSLIKKLYSCVALRDGIAVFIQPRQAQLSFRTATKCVVSLGDKPAGSLRADLFHSPPCSDTVSRRASVKSRTDTE